MGLASRLSAAQASSGAPPPAQQQQSYAPPPPAQSYAPPPGAPPQGGQYGAAPPAYSDNGYNPYAQGGKSIYAPPPGPPPALQPGRPASQYAPPPGAPPVPGSSYPGQQQQQQSYGPPPGAPPQPYGAPPPSAGGHANAATDYTQILRLLQHTVTDQHIEAFYPPGSGRLEHVAQRVAQTGVLAKVAQDWRMPLELAMDLAKLALFDVVLYCDDSGSMQFEEGGSRIDDLKLIVQRAAFAASLFDDDGIEVRFMNSQISGRGIKSEADAMSLVNQVRFSGLTPLGTALDQKVLQPLVLGPARQGTLQKPVVVIAVTDGVPGGESRDTLVRVIVNASRELARTRYGPDALSVTLAQIGNDQKARAFLEEIDEHPEVGGLVDCTSNYENEEDNFRRTTGQELTPELWLMKLLLGSVSSDWDLKDETK